MNIGIFTCNYSPLVNGLSLSIERFTSEFRRRGHRVYIFAPRYPGYSDRGGDVFRFPSLRAPTHHSYVLPLPFSPRIGQHLPRLGLDLVHAQHPFLLGPYAMQVARNLGIPLVFTHHTLYEKYAHYFPFFRKVTERLAISRAVAFANKADLVIAPTNGVKKLLESQGVRSRLEVVPTGVELPGEGVADPPSVRHRFGISAEARLCLYLGRLAKEKGLDFLLRSFQRIAECEARAVLLLVGEGDERRPLSLFTRDLGLRGRVLFAGPCPPDETHSFYGAADLFLFPSLSEAQGLVVLEAMACGAPVVARRSLAVEDFVEDGRDGFLTEDGPEGFAEKALLLLGNEELRRSFSWHARKKASRFSIQACAERMLELYEGLIENKSHRRLSRPVDQSTSEPVDW